MKLAWTLTAFCDLEQIYQYIAQDKPKAALDLIAHIDSLTQQLTQFPSMGRPGRTAGTREMIVAHTPYFIVYRVRKTQIEILAVLHSAKKIPPNWDNTSAESPYGCGDEGDRTPDPNAASVVLSQLSYVPE